MLPVDSSLHVAPSLKIFGSFETSAVSATGVKISATNASIEVENGQVESGQ